LRLKFISQISADFEFLHRFYQELKVLKLVCSKNLGNASSFHPTYSQNREQRGSIRIERMLNHNQFDFTTHSNCYHKAKILNFQKFIGSLIEFVAKEWGAKKGGSSISNIMATQMHANFEACYKHVSSVNGCR
jgi:hypothetical protein